jgi:hypothetical protein
MKKTFQLFWQKKYHYMVLLDTLLVLWMLYPKIFLLSFLLPFVFTELSGGYFDHKANEQKGVRQCPVCQSSLLETRPTIEKSAILRYCGHVLLSLVVAWTIGYTILLFNK